jgi:hypothetical protein
LQFQFDDGRGCHKFYYLAPFAVLDSFSHPFLPCQCLFTFCVVWRINFRTVSYRTKMPHNKMPCLLKNPRYTFYTIKSSLKLAYYFEPF